MKVKAYLKDKILKKSQHDSEHIVRREEKYKELEMEREKQKLKSISANTIIDKKFIESNEYRRKFDNISENHKLNRTLYNLAKRMLEHRNGTYYEDMYWIEPVDCKIVAQELNSTEEKKIIYSKNTKKVVKNMKKLITIHSHPDGFPPSVDDINSNYRNRYSLGVVCGHNGKVFIYSANGEINKIAFALNVLKFQKNGYNESEAQFLALQKMSESYKIRVKEV